MQYVSVIWLKIHNNNSKITIYYSSKQKKRKLSGEKEQTLALHESGNRPFIGKNTTLK